MLARNVAAHVDYGDGVVGESGAAELGTPPHI